MSQSNRDRATTPVPPPHRTTPALLAYAVASERVRRALAELRQVEQELRESIPVPAIDYLDPEPDVRVKRDTIPGIPAPASGIFRRGYGSALVATGLGARPSGRY